MKELLLNELKKLVDTQAFNEIKNSDYTVEELAEILLKQKEYDLNERVYEYLQ